MAIAMKLNFVDVLRDGSLKNTYVNGEKMGYKFDIRLSYYRGHFLSVIDKLKLKVDGKEVKQDDITFCLHGKEFGVAQLHDLVSEFWPILEPATIKVFQKGGLSAGEHDINFTLIFHSPYMPVSETEYMPWDSSQAKRMKISEY